MINLYKYAVNMYFLTKTGKIQNFHKCILTNSPMVKKLDWKKQKEVEQLFFKHSVGQKGVNKRINPFADFVEKRSKILLKVLE